MNLMIYFSDLKFQSVCDVHSFQILMHVLGVCRDVIKYVFLRKMATLVTVTSVLY